MVKNEDKGSVPVQRKARPKKPTASKTSVKQPSPAEEKKAEEAETVIPEESKAEEGKGLSAEAELEKILEEEITEENAKVAQETYKFAMVDKFKEQVAEADTAAVEPATMVDDVIPVATQQSKKDNKPSHKSQRYDFYGMAWNGMEID